MKFEFKIPENLKTLFLPTGKKIQGKVKYLLIGQINVPINYNQKKSIGYNIFKFC